MGRTQTLGTFAALAWLFSPGALGQPATPAEPRQPSGLVKTPGTGGAVATGPIVKPATRRLGSDPEDAQLPGTTPFEAFTSDLGNIKSDIVKECSARDPASMTVPSPIQNWCADYTKLGGNQDARRWDIVALLSSRAALLAVFLSEREELASAVQEFAAARKRLAGDGTLLAQKKSLGAPLGAPAAAIFNPEVLLDRLFAGIALALQKRAEQEAVDYALRSIQQNVCESVAREALKEAWARNDEKKRKADALYQAAKERLDGLQAAQKSADSDVVPAGAKLPPLPRGGPTTAALKAATDDLSAREKERGVARAALQEAITAATTLHARDLLRNTCALADAQAFDGSGSGSGLASLEMLRGALREDLLSLPAGLAAQIVRETLNANPIPDEMREHKEEIEAARAHVVEAVEALVDHVVRRHPVFIPAWEAFARDLAFAAEMEPKGWPEREALRWIALAVDAPPGVRYNWQVSSGNAGRETQETLAAASLMLALRRPAFAPMREHLGLGSSPAAAQWVAFYIRAARSTAMASSSLVRAAQLLADAEAQLASTTGKDGGAVATAALLEAADTVEKDATPNAKAAAARLRESAAAPAAALDRARAAALASAGAIAALDASVDAVDVMIALASGPLSDKAAESARTARLAVGRARAVERIVVAGIALDLQDVFQQLVRFQRNDQGSCAAGFGCVPISPTVLRWSGVAVSLASAKSSQEVSDVLLAASAPVGAWRLKYKPSDEKLPFRTALGGLVGMRFLHRNPSPGTLLSAPQLSAPVGVDVAFPLIPALNAAVFLQVLDLGGYLDFGGNGHSAPRVLQGVSPGVLGRLGLFGSPLTISGGIAYDVDAGGPAPADGSRPGGGWRPTMFVGLDVPLFMLSR